MQFLEIERSVDLRHQHGATQRLGVDSAFVVDESEIPVLLEHHPEAGRPDTVRALLLASRDGVEARRARDEHVDSPRLPVVQKYLPDV